MIEWLITHKQQVLVGLLILAVVSLGVSASTGWLGYWEADWWLRHESVQRKLEKELKALPWVVEVEGREWEGQIISRIEAAEGEEVLFWYDDAGVSAVERLGRYQTSFDCFRTGSEGEKLAYVYSVSLQLRDQRFAKWIPIKAVSLRDWVVGYPDIMSYLELLPKGVETRVFADEMGERLVRRERESEYVLYPETDQAIECDLWLL